MRNALLYQVVLTLGILLAWPVMGAAPASQPVQYHEEVRQNPPQHLHIATVDLTDPRVSLRVVPGAPDPDGQGPWQTKLDTVRNIATREKLYLAVNGSFFGGRQAMDVLGKKVQYFSGNWARVTGLAMTDGTLWASERSPVTLVVNGKGQVNIGHYAQPPADARQAVGANALIVNHGQIGSQSHDVAPRTAIGIDRAGKKLVLLVVDGRRDDYSVGMDDPQLAQEMIRLGCWDAIALDGGGSSTMVMYDADEKHVKLLNHPSDGHDLPLQLSIERPVANAFGVVIKDAPATQP